MANQASYTVRHISQQMYIFSTIDVQVRDILIISFLVSVLVIHG